MEAGTGVPRRPPTVVDHGTRSGSCIDRGTSWQSRPSEPSRRRFRRAPARCISPVATASPRPCRDASPAAGAPCAAIRMHAAMTPARSRSGSAARCFVATSCVRSLSARPPASCSPLLSVRGRRASCCAAAPTRRGSPVPPPARRPARPRRRRSVRRPRRSVCRAAAAPACATCYRACRDNRARTPVPGSAVALAPSTAAAST